MTLARTLPADDSRWSPRLWGILVVLCGALFLDALDVSMVGVALPSIRAALGLSTASLQWVVSGYVLGYGGLLLLGGRAADLLGRRRVFLVALGVFAVASLLGGLVSTGPLLIAARLIKGMAAAFTAPAGLSIITTTFAEGPARNRALSIYSAFGAGGFSLGLVLSGLLTEISWRWTLLLPAPVATIVLIAGLRLIPRGDRVDRGGRRFDLPGAATVTGGMLLLVYAVVNAPQAGWASARTLISFAGAAALLAAFTIIERRSTDPLVRLAIFSSRTLTRANLAAMVLFGSYVSFQFLVTQYLQIMAGWSALSTALAFLPAGVLVVVASTQMGPVLDRFGPAKVVAVGFACLAAGYAWFLRVGPAPDYPAVLLPAVLLIGAAFGLGFASLNIQATAGVADHEQGLASGILQTSFQIGGAIVLAVVTAVIDARGANRVISAHTLTAYRPALDVIAGIAALGVVIALTGLRRPRPVPAALAATPASEPARHEAAIPVPPAHQPTETTRPSATAPIGTTANGTPASATAPANAGRASEVSGPTTATNPPGAAANGAQPAATVLAGAGRANEVSRPTATSPVSAAANGTPRAAVTQATAVRAATPPAARPVAATAPGTPSGRATPVTAAVPARSNASATAASATVAEDDCGDVEFQPAGC